MRAKQWTSIFIFFVLILNSAVVRGSSQPATINPAVAQKITFDLNSIPAGGLQGPVDGLVAVDYEFCIPGRKQYADEVRSIDPTVIVHKGSSGRIGCSQEEYLCIGSTHQRGFKAVLYKLAGLAYIKRIDRCYWE